MDYFTEALVLDRNAAAARRAKNFEAAASLQKRANEMYRKAGRTK